MANKAVFLDRDGVLIEQVLYLSKKEEVKIIPRVPEALQKLKMAGYKLILITNQPVIAMGLATPSLVNAINQHIISLIGVPLDACYVCPHHPVKGNIAEYIRECACRKPQPGMIIEAAKQHAINLKASYMIGDTRSDIKAGKAAGCKTVLVKTGHAGTDVEHQVEPDFEVVDLYEASQIILKSF